MAIKSDDISPLTLAMASQMAEKLSKSHSSSELALSIGGSDPKTEEQPTLVKSIINLLNGEEGSITRLAFEQDPAQNTWNGVYKQKLRLLPDKVLKRIAIQDDLVASIVQARQNHISAFGRARPDRFSTGFVIEPHQETVEQIDAIKDDKKRSEVKHALRRRIAEITKRISTCGSTKGWGDEDLLTLSRYLAMSVRNLIVVGRMATEVIWVDGGDGKKHFHSFRVIDAGTIYRTAQQKRSDKAVDRVRAAARSLLESVRGEKLDPERYMNDEYAWVQVIDDRPVQAFTAKECLVHQFYSVPDVELDGYPVTPLDTVISAVTTHINITTHNKLYFQSGRASRGMLVVKSENINQQVINRMRQEFQAQINSVSNCLTGDTQIITEQGAVEIEKFLGGRETRMTKVWTGTEWCDAMAYRVAEPKILCKTKLSNGIELKTSPEHRFWVIGSSGTPEWKTQKDLQIGDFVAVNKHNASAETVPHFQGKPLTEDMLEVFGWVTGDGSISDRAFKLYYHHEKERDIWQRHAKILADWGLPVRAVEREVPEEEKEHIKARYGFKSVADTRLTIDINSKSFVSEFLNLGFTVSAKKNGGKCIPEFLHILPLRFKAAFLRGLFSADGNNAKGLTPEITIANNSLRSEVRLLLLSMGIRTSLSEGISKLVFNGPARTVVEAPSVLRIKDRKEFFEHIGFIQEHKQPVTPRGTNKDWGVSNRIPRETITKYLGEVREKTRRVRGGDLNLRLERAALPRVFSNTQQSYIGQVLNGEQCSLPRLMNYMQMAGVEIPSWMTDYNYEQVVEVTNTGELVQMFDTTVYEATHNCTGATCQSDKHSLITGGVYTHQSWRMPCFGIGPSDEVQWMPIDSGGRDMEFQYLSDMNARVILSAFQISPEELPGWSYLSRGTNAQSLAEGNREFLLEAHRDLGIRPLLATIEDFLNHSILPLFDEELAKLCAIKLVGLEAESVEKESIRIQQDSVIHLTMDEILQKVQKRPIGDRWGGNYLFNPSWQAVADKFIKVGDQLEHFFGVEGASKDPQFDYLRDPFFWQQRQWLMQQQQMQQQQQQMQEQQAQAQQAQGQAQPQEQGSDQQQGQSQPQAQQQQPQQQQQQQEQSGQQGQQDSNQPDLTSAVNQALDSLHKSEAEKSLPPAKRRLMAQQKLVVEAAMSEWDKELAEASKEIIELASRLKPKS